MPLIKFPYVLTYRTDHKKLRSFQSTTTFLKLLFCFLLGWAVNIRSWSSLLIEKVRKLHMVNYSTLAMFFHIILGLAQYVFILTPKCGHRYQYLIFHLFFSCGQSYKLMLNSHLKVALSIAVITHWLNKLFGN